MKFIKKKDGFTLIELLVTINISFFLILLIITFYLFITKYSLEVVNNIETKSKSFLFLNKTTALLKKCDYFEVTSYNDSLLINTSENNKIFISIDSCLIDGLNMSYNNINRINIKLFQNNEEKFNYNLDEEFDKIINKEFSISSKDFNKLSLMFIINGKIYQTTYYQDDISSKKFKNTDKL